MKCNFCEGEAAYDGKTIYGPWAFMCPNCFEAFGVGLGLGKGQKLEPTIEKEEDTKNAKIRGKS